MNALRNGWIRDPEDRPPPPPDTYLLWSDSAPNDALSRKYEPIAAPKVRLPGHNESYNPPEEYLLSKEQEEAWKEMEDDERYNPCTQRAANLSCAHLTVLRRAV